jgi:branched-chain amino acid transport system permease protein
MWRAPVMRGVAEGDTAIPLAAFANDERTMVWIAAAAFAAGVLTVAALLRSRTGIALRAAARDERDAAALGFDAPRLRLAAFVVAGAIAGAAGVLAAQFSGRASPAVFSPQVSLFVPAAALIGGPATVAGPAAAAYLVAAAALFLDIPSGIQLLVFAAVLALAGLRDPQHLLGTSFGWTPRGAGRDGHRRETGRRGAAGRNGSR